MTPAPLPSNEAERCASLHNLNVLDTAAEERFDRITRIACDRFRVPIALVSLVDSDRQWFKARRGLETTETSREISFCGHAIMNSDTFVVQDTFADSRFVDNPLVADEPGIRFYAGCPLSLSNGQRVGTLCLIDKVPRVFSAQDENALRELANLVVDELQRPEGSNATQAPGTSRSLGWRNVRNSMSSKAGAFTCALALMVVVGLFGFQFAQRTSVALNSVERNQLYGQLATFHANLDTTLYARLHLVEGLIGFVHAQPNADPAAFRRFARQLGTDTAAIRSLQLARGGTVSHVWPQEGNAEALGHNLLTDPERHKDAMAAIESRKTWLTGPVKLRQGGTALIARKPVFLDDMEAAGQQRFWGFAVVVLDFVELLNESSLPTEDDLGRYALREAGNQTRVIYGDPSVFTSPSAEIGVQLPGGDWVLAAKSTAAPASVSFQTTAAIVAIASLCSSFLYLLLRMPAQLQASISRATFQLRKSQEYLQNALNVLDDGFAIFDANDCLVISNEHFLNMYGIDRSQTAAQLTSKQVLDSALGRGLVQTGSSQSTTYLRRKWSHWEERAGTPWNCELTGGKILRVTDYAIPSGGRVSMHVDITESLAKSRQLEEAKLQAEHANNAKSIFLATVSHEVRTPLNGVLGLVGVVLEENKLPPRSRKHLTAAHESALHLLAILNGILDISKMEAGGLELETAPFSLRELVSSLRSLIEPQAQKKGLSFDCEMPASDYRVLGDEGRLRQVLLNLLSNAVKFTEHGGLTLELATQETESARSMRCAFKVIDTGLGIAEGDCQSIFDAFVQLERDPSRKYEGTGLGLSISQRLVGLMGGEISVESAPGKGACFHFSLELPLVGAVGVPLNEKAGSAKALQGVTVPDMRILVAEDTLTNQLVIRAMLNQPGLQVDVVNDGEAAVRAACTGVYDLVLMDIYMPNMDGIAATRAIREISKLKSLPIIALTASAMEGDREIYLTAGMDDYLPKPLKKQDLMACLLRWSPARMQSS